MGITVTPIKEEIAPSINKEIMAVLINIERIMKDEMVATMKEDLVTRAPLAAVPKNLDRDQRVPGVIVKLKTLMIEATIETMAIIVIIMRANNNSIGAMTTGIQISTRVLPAQLIKEREILKRIEEGSVVIMKEEMTGREHQTIMDLRTDVITRNLEVDIIMAHTI